MLLWMYFTSWSPENDQADRLVGKANMTSGFASWKIGIEELETLPGAQSQGHHTINHLEERGMERRYT